VRNCTTRGHTNLQYIRNPNPRSGVGKRRGTDTQTGTQTDRHTDTQTRVTNIHFAWCTTHAKCNEDCGPLFRRSTNSNSKPNLVLTLLALNLTLLTITLLTLTLTLTLTFGIVDLPNSGHSEYRGPVYTGMSHATLQPHAERHRTLAGTHFPSR